MQIIPVPDIIKHKHWMSILWIRNMKQSLTQKFNGHSLKNVQILWNGTHCYIKCFSTISLENQIHISAKTQDSK